MPNQSDFLPFATSPSANVATQAQWVADPVVPIGFVKGILPSAKTNKAIRQGSYMAAGLAQLVMQTLNQDVRDDGNLPYLTSQIQACIVALGSGAAGNPVVTIADNPPSPVSAGTLWWDSTDGQLYLYYNDGTSSQWVAADANSGLADAPLDGAAYGRASAAWVPVLGLGGGTLTGPLILAANPTVALGAATKQYVDTKVASSAQPATSVPLMASGSGAVGTSLLYARADHIHPADNTRAPLASPAFTGIPTAPTAAVGTSTTQLATTAFVANALVTSVAGVSTFNGRAGAVSLTSADVTAAGAAPLNAPAFTGVPTVAGGSITINSTGTATLVLNKAVGAFAAAILAYRNMVARWQLILGDGTTETGTGNTGSNAYFARYNDAGTLIDVPLSISRSTGAVTFGSAAPIVSPPAGIGASVILNKASATGQNANISGQSAGLYRWAVVLGNASAETGSNVGSDFLVQRFNDAGTFIENSLQITRSTGSVTLNGSGWHYINGPGATLISESPTGGHATLRLNKAGAAYISSIAGFNNGTTRWSVTLGNSTAESGSNAGSDFTISRNSDTGVALGNALTITRSSGNATFSNNLTAGGTLTVNSTAVITGALTASSTANIAGVTSIGGTLGVSGGQISVAGTTALLYMTANSVRQWYQQASNNGVYYFVDASSSLITASIGSGTGQWTFGYQLNAATIVTSGSVTVNGNFATNQINGTNIYGATLNASGGINQTVPNGGQAFIIQTVTSTRAWLTGCQSDGSYYIYDNSAAALRLHVNTAGAIDVANNFTLNAGQAYKPGGGSWAATSDIRIKNLVGDYARGLDDVLKLKPVIYVYKGNHQAEPEGTKLHEPEAEAHKRFVGFVAQDVEKIWPDMVSKTEGYIDGKKVDDLRQLDTSELIFALVNAVKALNDKVAALEEQLGA